MNGANNGSSNQVDDVVCTPSFVFPTFSGLDARHFVHQIPVSNQQQLSQQQILKFSKFNPKGHVLSAQDQKHLVPQNLSQSQLLAATISLPQATSLQQQQQLQQQQHQHLLQQQQNSHDMTNDLLNHVKQSQDKSNSQANGNNGQVNNSGGNNSSLVWACPSCKVPFKTAGELQSHLSSAHTKSEKSVPCEQCGKLFATSERVKIHIKVAHGAKSSTCHICGASFSYKCKLLDHMRTHTGDKPFQCDVCGRKFSQKNHVRRHKMIHTGERPFPCDICGRGFYRKDKLTRHRLIHTNPSSRKNKGSGVGNSRNNANNSASGSNANNGQSQSDLNSRSTTTLNNDNLTMQNVVSQSFGAPGNSAIPLIPVQLATHQWIASTSNSLNSVQNGENLNNKINTQALINAVST